MERVAEELRNYNYVNNVGLSDAEINEIVEDYFDEHHDFDKEFETGMLDAEFERLIEAKLNSAVIDRQDLPFLDTKPTKRDAIELDKISEFQSYKEFDNARLNSEIEDISSRQR